MERPKELKWNLYVSDVVCFMQVNQALTISYNRPAMSVLDSTLAASVNCIAVWQFGAIRPQSSEQNISI